MFRFEHPEYLLILLFLPLMARVYRWYLVWKKEALNRWRDESLSHINNSDNLRSRWKFYINITVIILLIIALANPQWPSKGKPIKREGIDIALLIDASLSMLAEDVNPNRLEIAKQLAQQFTDEATNERIALVSFAADPFTLLPLTQDHAAVNIFLQALQANASEVQGSDLGTALTHTIQALPENQNHYKAIVLFSDGEDNEKHLEEALQLAHKNNVVICTVGIGTEKGITIPDSTSAFNQKVKHDVKGNIVITQLQPHILKSMADKTNGIYIPYSDQTRTIPVIANRINKIKKNVYDEKLFTTYESKYQYLLIPVLLLMLFEFLINRIRLPKVKYS